MRKSFIKDLKDEKLTIGDRLEDLLLYNRFSIFLRKITRFILRLIRWIPVLYKQEEWDYEYIYDILELKMKELRKNISKDTWHTEHCVKRELLQIDICLARMDRFRNWEKYINVPNEEIKFISTGDGYSRLNMSEEYNKEKKKGISFEKKNYDKFWKDFVHWHNNWWT